MPAGIRATSSASKSPGAATGTRDSGTWISASTVRPRRASGTLANAASVTMPVGRPSRSTTGKASRPDRGATSAPNRWTGIDA